MSLTFKETENICCFDTRENKIIYYAEKKKNNILEYEGHLEPMPRNPTTGKENETSFICGASGSGKTYYLRQYACNYKRLNPDNKIFMITQSKNAVFLRKK